MIVYWLQIHIPTYMDLTKSYKAKLKAAKLIYFKESTTTKLRPKKDNNTLIVKDQRPHLKAQSLEHGDKKIKNQRLLFGQIRVGHLEDFTMQL